MALDSPASPTGDEAADTALLSEAADWVLTLRYGDVGDKERRDFEQWRQRSPAHGLAWARAENVLGAFEHVPAEIGKNVLQAVPAMMRRRNLRLLGGLLVAGPAAWLGWRQLPWRQWSADVTTATSERKSITLADGTRLVLNSGSAVDIVFSAGERRVRLLAGEVLITTHADPSPTYRPFLVQTPQGLTQALGTRFSVRLLEVAGQQVSRVSVFADSVEIRPHGAAGRILRANQQADFGAGRIAASVAVAAGAALWERGMLLAKNMRLADVIAELGRHRGGILRCDPGVAELRISGAISLDDSDAALALLERSLPLRVERTTRYWVTVTRR